MQNEQNIQHGEIILYQPNETVRLEVRLENDTVWLNRQQMADLFGRDVKTIGKHIGNALKEELRQVPTVAKFATVQLEGNRRVVRNIEFYKIEATLADHQERIDFFVRTNQPPVEGVLFEGQIFDAYKLVEELVKSAKREAPVCL